MTRAKFSRDFTAKFNQQSPRLNKFIKITKNQPKFMKTHEHNQKITSYTVPVSPRISRCKKGGGENPFLRMEIPSSVVAGTKSVQGPREYTPPKCNILLISVDGSEIQLTSWGW